MIEKIKTFAIAHYNKGIAIGVALGLPIASYAYTLPTMDATTTAAFTATGISAQVVYDTLVLLMNQGLSFGLFLIQVAWPFLLVVGFVYLLWRLAHKFTGIGR